MKIMLADDDRSVRKLVRSLIEEKGFEFCCAQNGSDAIDVYNRERPDLIILDVMMPERNGFEVCAELRGMGSSEPIIFLTAKGDIVDKSIGFGFGADDYLAKPFHPQELTLRVDALLRRRAVKVETGCVTDYIKYEDLEIDVQRRKVYIEGKSVDLTPKEFHILLLLANNVGQVISREQLIRDVWGEEYVGETTSVAVMVRRIRKKIEKDPSSPRYLQTVWRIGYRLGD